MPDKRSPKDWGDIEPRISGATTQAELDVILSEIEARRGATPESVYQAVADKSAALRASDASYVDDNIESLNRAVLITGVATSEAEALAMLEAEGFTVATPANRPVTVSLRHKVDEKGKAIRGEYVIPPGHTEDDTEYRVQIGGEYLPTHGPKSPTFTVTAARAAEIDRYNRETYGVDVLALRAESVNVTHEADGSVKVTKARPKGDKP